MDRNNKITYRAGLRTNMTWVLPEDTGDDVIYLLTYAGRYSSSCVTGALHFTAITNVAPPSSLSTRTISPSPIR